MHLSLWCRDWLKSSSSVYLIRDPDLRIPGHGRKPTPRVIDACMKTSNLKLIPALLTLTTLTLSGPSAMAWNWGNSESANNPAQFEKDYEYHYSLLPLKGQIKTPWSETYWPSNKGSINFRWSAEHERGFRYRPPTRQKVQTMSREELKELSPSEKYDLAMGHYDYPLHRSVSDEMASKRARSWEGLCNGWAPASLYYPEPKAVEITNPDGIVIPFGSSDVKGLISYFMAVEGDEQVETSQVGLRCDNKPWLGKGPDECDDVNAGALHVILTNEIGKRGHGFVADMTRTKEVWNQPIFGYEMQELGSAKTKEADHGIRIRTKILYGEELDHSRWEPTVGTTHNKIGSQTVEYILELDRDGKIVGGDWITKKVHPDFLWRVDSQKDIRFNGTMEGLNRIYSPNL